MSECPFCIAFVGACAVCEEDEYDAERKAEREAAARRAEQEATEEA